MASLLTLSWLKNNEEFLDCLSKLSLRQELSQTQKSLTLAVAILFIKSYEKDRRRTSHFEFGYHLILNYSIQYGDYEPLFDVSTNFGFYPITKYLFEKEFIDTGRFSNYLTEKKLENFQHNGITETYEQRRSRVEILSGKATESAYIAPTSFGKSSLFIELLETLKPTTAAIIVPTKSLLTQTYRNVNKHFPDRKIIFHDEMFDETSEGFIAVFTQERALRLMKNHDVSFDLLMIDEAHNIFESDYRSVLLTRVIRRNKSRNPNAKVHYFSPLITDSDNLRIESSQSIEEHNIKFNVKDPELYEYGEDGKAYYYSRFLDEYFETKPYHDFIDYILENSKKNNFLYLRSPRKVESLAKVLSERITEQSSKILNDLADTIAENVHEEFYAVEMASKGLIYLHGKLPDLVKEYLEYKFRNTAELKYMVANTVVLEGVNLPIDNLFILNTHSLNEKDLINLIGRVNRLNEVFSKTTGSLDKLLPNVHFVNSEYRDLRGKMSNKMKLLGPKIYKDTVKNPILLNFDIEYWENKATNSTSDKERLTALQKIQAAFETQRKEALLIDEFRDEQQEFKAALIESNIDAIYSDLDSVSGILFEKATKLKSDKVWLDTDTIDKVFEFFIDGLDSEIRDENFLRLRNTQARNFYKGFVKSAHTLSLKQQIDETVRYFYTILNKQSGVFFYIGDSYGEISREQNSNQKRYVNLSEKSHKELVNLALIKIKMESDFVSYKLNQYITFLFEQDLLLEADYNLFIYGTSKKKNTEFSKLGFSGTLISRLERDNQLRNIYFNDLGHVVINDEFRAYIEQQNDLVKFEVTKYIEL